MKTDDMTQLVEDFTKVITFKIIYTIKKLYESLEDFKKQCSKNAGNEALARFNKNFHIDEKTLHGLTTSRTGKRRLKAVIKSLRKDLLVYKRKCDIKTKKGKMFSKPSTWHIPFRQLDMLFKLHGTKDNNPFDATSSYYTPGQRSLIFKYILCGNAKKRKPYTKSEKFLQYVARRKEKKQAKEDKPLAKLLAEPLVEPQVEATPVEATPAEEKPSFKQVLVPLQLAKLSSEGDDVVLPENFGRDMIEYLGI